MPKPKPRDIPDVQVDDANAAFRKMEGFTRKVMAVPKRDIDTRAAKENGKKHKRH
jgi:hypothetical protein